MVKFRRKVLTPRSDLFRLLSKYSLFISGVLSKYVYFFSKNDFVLRVAPLSNPYITLSGFVSNRVWGAQSRKLYFPPPGYGIPPRKADFRNPSPHAQYGLFLWPGKLTRDFFIFMLIVNGFVVLPFIFSKFPLVSSHPMLFILGLAFVSGLLFRGLFKIIPPVLSQIWQEWPESQYEHFLTVPHRVELKWSDKSKEKNRDGIYWRPDEATPMRHQSSSYAAGMNTLQEVMLHLAIFDFFFHKKEVGETEQFKSIKTKNWILYLLAPVWITYGILLFFLLIYQIKLPTFSLNLPTIVQYPYNFLWATVSWFFLSSFFIISKINILKRQEKAVIKGFYNAHLALIPQQILKAITQIPDEKQIRDGIDKLATLLRTIQTVGLVSLFMIIEIFSSPYSQVTDPPKTSDSKILCQVEAQSKDGLKNLTCKVQNEKK